MFHKITISFILSALTCQVAFSQLEMFDVRDFSMGSSSIATQPIHGISKNPSLFPKGNNSYISCIALNNYFIRELTPVQVKYIHKFSENTSINGGLGKMGNTLFSQQYLEAGIAKKLGSKLFVGIRFRYNQWVINESHYENRVAWTPEIGIYSAPIQNFFFGVIIRNPVRFRMNTIEKNSYPTEINPGIAYNVSDKVTLALSALQINNRPLLLESGIEYRFLSNLLFRFGILTAPVRQSFGIGIKMSNVIIDIGVRTNPYLGNSSAIALTFAL